MRKTNQPRYRRAPFLVSYWQDGNLVIHNYATGVAVTAAPIACEVLDFFARWRPAEDLIARHPEYTSRSLRGAIHQLLRRTLLETSLRRRAVPGKNLASWELWNPSAGFFHFSTRDFPYEPDLETQERFVRELAARYPKPAPSKHYPGAKRWKLSQPRQSGELARALAERRTWRQFSRAPLRESELSTLLALTWGVQQSLPLEGVGRFVLKTSPSAGALHPIEAYVLVRRVAGVPRGIYHYDAARHCLERLEGKISRARLTNYLAGQSWFAGAAAVVFMTAVFPRMQWKYRFPRAYRTVLLDAGHLCQTFCLLAASMGLAPFSTMALAESRIEKDLRLDGVTEGVIYAAGVGRRPPGIGWQTGSIPEILFRKKKRR